MMTDAIPPELALQAALTAAFAHRGPPGSTVDPASPRTEEYDDARALQGLDARRTESDVLAIRHLHGAFFGLTPEAFCHWLPAIARISLHQTAPGSVWPLAADALVGQLDRGLGPDGWDGFFSARFGRLGALELAALQDWVLWLSSSGAGAYEQDVLERAYITLEHLRDAHQTADR